MGVNRSVIEKLLNQANKSLVYKEAWYSFFKFLTQMATLPGHRLLIIGEICDYFIFHSTNISTKCAKRILIQFDRTDTLI